MSTWIDLPGCPLRIALIAPVAAATMAAPALAQEPVEYPAPVRALLDDLAAGNRDQAISRIDIVENLSSAPRIVRNSREFVDRMLGCSVSEVRDGMLGADFRVFFTTMRCEDGDYKVTFGHEDGSPYVSIADFQDPATIAAREASPPVAMIPPPAPTITTRPRPETEEERTRRLGIEQARQERVCTALGEAMLNGEAGELAELGIAESRFIFGFHDPIVSTMVVEEDGRGPDAAQAMVDAARNAVGIPASYQCQTENIGLLVRWTFEPADRALFAMPVIRGNVLTSVTTRYATREKLLEAQQRYSEMQASE